MDKIIVFDIETTGLYPEKGDMILEIGALPIVNNEIIIDSGFEKLVNPGIDIPPEATSINQITNEMVRDAASIEEVLPEFLTYVKDYPLIAHNAAFDIGFLNYFARNIGSQYIKNRVIDTMEISKRIFSHYKHHNLDSVLMRLGISYNIRQRHRSIADAYLTARAYLKMRNMI